jgi:hypothetical protein
MASNTTNFSELLYPGLAAIWGLVYPDYTPEWSQVFPVTPSRQAYEKSLGMSGFGLAPIKTEGKAVDYDDPFQGPTHTLTHFVRGLGFVVTKEMYTDDLYNKINALPKALKKSMLQTKEWDHFNVLNYAFTASSAYYGADGVELCSLLHPLNGGGYVANKPAVAADLSLTALEQADIDIQAFVDGRGLKVNVKMRKLLVSTSDNWTAKQLLGSDKDPETPASNAINVAKGMFPEGHMVCHYLTDTDAWFILTNAENALVSYKRWPLEFAKDNDFGSDNALYKATERYVAGWDDPLGVYGSAGA